MFYQKVIIFLMLATVLLASAGVKPRSSPALQRAVAKVLPPSFETLSGAEFAIYLMNKASQGQLAESVAEVFVSNSYVRGSAALSKAYRQLLASEQEVLGNSKDGRLLDDEKVAGVYQELIVILQDYGYDVPQQSYQEVIAQISGEVVVWELERDRAMGYML